MRHQGAVLKQKPKAMEILFILKYFCHHYVITLLDRTAVALAGHLLSVCIISVDLMTSIHS